MLYFLKEEIYSGYMYWWTIKFIRSQEHILELCSCGMQLVQNNTSSCPFLCLYSDVTITKVYYHWHPQLLMPDISQFFLILPSLFISQAVVVRILNIFLNIFRNFYFSFSPTSSLWPKLRASFKVWPEEAAGTCTLCLRNQLSFT